MKKVNIRLSVLMAEKNMKLNTLSEKTGISIQNLSILKNNKAKAIRFTTLMSICEALECEPGELITTQ